jgi:hypothetical protein
MKSEPMYVFEVLTSRCLALKITVTLAFSDIGNPRGARAIAEMSTPKSHGKPPDSLLKYVALRQNPNLLCRLASFESA